MPDSQMIQGYKTCQPGMVLQLSRFVNGEYVCIFYYVESGLELWIGAKEPYPIDVTGMIVIKIIEITVYYMINHFW